MRRRSVLRAGGAALGFGVGAVGRAGAHDPPDGAHTPPEDSTATETTTPVSDGYEPLGRVDVVGTTEAVVGDEGRVAYLATTTGYATVDLSDPAAPAVLASEQRPLADREDGPLPQIYDVKQDGDTLLVVGPANAQQGVVVSGALVVDVSDPAAPERRGFYETAFPVHNSFLDGDTAYLTANSGEGTWLELVDVGADPPERLGRWRVDDVDERWGEVARGLRVVHDVYVQDGLAYVAHWDAGTWLVDVSDPTAPEAVGRVGDYDLDELVSLSENGSGTAMFTLPGNSHYAAVDESGDLLGVGREAWAVSNGDGRPGGIDLFDVSDPAAPEHLAHVHPPPTPDPTLRGVWTTAHNFEFRDGVLYSSWYRGGVKRHDVSDPTNPRELTYWRDPNVAEFWTARSAVPGETFVASSRGTGAARAGLFVFPDEAGRTIRPLGRARGASSTSDPGAADTRTGTSSANTEPTDSRAPTTTSDARGSGFGALAALAGVGAGALGLARRRRRER